MEIIDAQIHEPLPWLAEIDEKLTETQRNELATELALAMMDTLGIQYAMISSTTRPAWGFHAIARVPERLCIKTRVDPLAPDLDDQVAKLRLNPGIRGIRVSGWPDEKLNAIRTGGYDRTFQAAQRHGLPISIYAPEDVGVIGLVARAHPDLTVIIEHVGLPQPMPAGHIVGDVPRFKRLPATLELSAFPNVVLMLGGLCTLSMEPYPFRDLREPVERMIEAFGIERIMWGSDNQRVQGRFFNFHHREPYIGKHTYYEALAFIRDSDWLSATDKQQLLSGTFRNVYGWPPASS